MKSVIYLPDDEIVRQNDKGEDLYFISKGTLNVYLAPEGIDYHDLMSNIMTVGTKKVTTLDKDEQESTRSKLIKVLECGDYFGEISILTNMKRTATVVAQDFSNLASVNKKVFGKMKSKFPLLYMKFKNSLKGKYTDENFRYRLSLLKNTPYFSKLSDEVMLQLVFLMKRHNISENQVLLKRGENT